MGLAVTGFTGLSERALPSPLALGVAVLLLIGFALVPPYLIWTMQGVPLTDFHQTFSRLTADEPYAVDPFRWSPPAAWLLTTVIVPLGIGAWRALHLVALLAIRDRRVVTGVLLTFPFWMDFYNGNVMTFVLVSAWTAVHGNRAGTVAFLALSVLVPRPLMLPVLAWLLWRQPWSRWVFALLALTVLAASIATGQLGPFVDRLLLTPGGEVGGAYDRGPSAVIGMWWTPIGLALAAILTYRGRLGLASLAVSPYLLGYYYIMLALELRSDNAVDQSRQGDEVAGGSGLGRAERGRELGRGDGSVDGDTGRAPHVAGP